MSTSFTQSETQTFTVTHAKYLASKVAADLRRIMRLYGGLTEYDISLYEEEATEFLRKGYLGTVTYGFKKDDKWIEPTLIYTAKELSSDSFVDDDPGRVAPNANITGAIFYSYLTYSAAWEKLTASEKETFKGSVTLKRTGAPQPGINGYLASDKSYASGGRSLDRSTVKSF